MSYTATVHHSFISCLQRRSSIVQLDSPFLQFCLCLVSPRNVGSLSRCGRDHMWPRHTRMFRSPGSPTDASLPGWQPVPSALGWPSAMYSTAVCDHSGVTPLGGRQCMHGYLLCLCTMYILSVHLICTLASSSHVYAGFLLRAGTRVIYPAMTLHVPGYRPDGRSFFSVTCVRLDSQ